MSWTGCTACGKVPDPRREHCERRGGSAALRGLHCLSRERSLMTIRSSILDPRSSHPLTKMSQCYGPNKANIKSNIASFGGLVLGCSNADFCNQTLVLLHFFRNLHFLDSFAPLRSKWKNFAPLQTQLFTEDRQTFGHVLLEFRISVYFARVRSKSFSAPILIKHFRYFKI